MPATSKPNPPSACGSKETLELAVRQLGIAISKIGVYGGRHPASVRSTEEALAAWRSALAERSPVEVSVEQHVLMANGEAVDPAAGQLLAMHLERQKTPGFSFTPPLDPTDFTAFVALLGTAPQQLEAEGGVVGAMQKSGLRGIRPVQTSYVRKTGPGESPEKGDAQGSGERPPDHEPPPTPRPVPKTAPAPKTPQVLDLTLDMTLEEAVQALSGEEPTFTHPQPPAPPTPSLLDLQPLLSQLRELASALGPGTARGGSSTPPPLLSQLRQGVSSVADDTRTRIAAIAAAAQADRRLVASLEEEARARGLPLQTSRDELLAQLAEVVQELRQPLTVATGVVDMMLGGNLDAITDNQREMLKLAGESMDLASQLSMHITELVGYPAGLHPDRKVLETAYRPKA